MATKPESTRSAYARPSKRLSRAGRCGVKTDFVAANHIERCSRRAGKSPAVVLLACIMVAGITSTLVGCATIRGERYTYASLPHKYVAQAIENAQTIDLSKLGNAASTTDVIDQGDVVEVTINAGLNEKDTTKMLLRVSDEGFADVPEVGHIKLAGLEVTAAESAIGKECIQQGLYQRPSVTVIMKHQRMNHITVTGAVKKPKIYELPRGRSDLLSALSAAEGLDTMAGTEIIIKNPTSALDSVRNSVAGRPQGDISPTGHTVETAGDSTNVIKVNLVSATKNNSGGYQLNDGAVVYVQKRDPEPIYVLGLVNRPGRFEYPPNKELRVTDAVAMAWGVSSLAANKIFVIRHKPEYEIDPNADPANPDKVKSIVIQVSLANAKQKAEANVRLQPGDVVSVEQTPLTFMLMMFMRVGVGVGTTLPLTGTPLL